jgi:hypothetical protein
MQLEEEQRQTTPLTAYLIPTARILFEVLVFDTPPVEHLNDLSDLYPGLCCWPVWSEDLTVKVP